MTGVFVGAYYEVYDGVVKKYYYAGDVRVAGEQRRDAVLLVDRPSWFHRHDDGCRAATGLFRTELRYYPYGAVRYNPGGQITTFRFTGQRWDSGTAIYFYDSRWYDPVVGRFLQADTIVPEPGDPQSLNRYSYTLNNPLRFVDSTGHAEQCPDGDICGSIIYSITPRPASEPNWVYLIGNDPSQMHISPAGLEFTAVGGDTERTA